MTMMLGMLAFLLVVGGLFVLLLAAGIICLPKPGAAIERDKTIDGECEVIR